VTVTDRDAVTYRDLQAARRAAGACVQRERRAVGAYERACSSWVIGRGTLGEVKEAEVALDALRVESRRVQAAVDFFAARVPSSH